MHRKMKYKVIIIILLALTSVNCPSALAQVLFLDVPEQPSELRKHLERACQFYGLRIVNASISKAGERSAVAEPLENGDIAAIVINAEALRSVDFETTLSTLVERHQDNLSILLLGLNPEIDGRILGAWSDGVVSGCKSVTGISDELLYRVLPRRRIARHLSGLAFPNESKEVNYLIIDETSKVEKVVQLENRTGTVEFPVFVETALKGHRVFFLADNRLGRSTRESVSPSERSRFLQIAPLMMFLRHACGERCWHSPGYYANLTIDDPWLTEPYGHLSYFSLLKQMQKANFHTTIAFIPWNYDRSEPELVPLLHDHPERFSICVHGNNHDHREFYRYKTTIKDPWPARPLKAQEADIQQAIARMEEFRRLTGLPYERVMVFPHGIAPSNTLSILKKLNFLATSNVDNIPLGSKTTSDTLLGFTLEFENFVSLDRYSARDVTQSDVAMNLFLGNPLLMFGHHDLFKDGSNAFNRTAETINVLEPDTEWRSLGYIAQRLYRQRVRKDGGYDVSVFSRKIELENASDRHLTYHVRKAESFMPPVRQVTVGGSPYPYERLPGELALTIDIPSGKSRIIEVEYQNDFDPALIELSKDDQHINRLRMLSDFRDMTLSRNLFGRVLIDAYYRTGLYKFGVKRLMILTVLLAVLGGASARYLMKRHRIRYHRKA